MKNKAFTIISNFFQKTIFIWIAFFYFLCVVFVFRNILDSGFFSDDFHALSVVKYQTGVLHYFTSNIIGERGGSSYGPILNILYTGEYHLFGLEARLYHMVNLFLLFLSGLLVCGIAKKITRNSLISFGAGLLFLVLPNRSETVSWVASQPHLFATFFYLCAALLFIVWIEKRNILWYVASFFAIALSLFTKEIGITFPAVFFLFFILLKDERFSLRYIGKLILTFLPYVFLLAGLLYLREMATHTLFGYYGKEQLEFTSIATIRMLVELTTSMFFSHPQRGEITGWILSHQLVLIAFFSVPVLSVVLWWREWKQGAVFLLSYGLICVPYLSLMFNPVSDEGERYGYLPSFAFVLFVAGTVYSLARLLRPIATPLYIILVLGGSGVCGYVLIQKNEAWEIAGKVVRSIQNSTLELKVGEKDYISFVGLPDHLLGAQLYRNAIKESLVLFHDKTFAQADRIPMYESLNKENAFAQNVKIVQKNYRTWEMQSEQERFFTGFPHLDEKYAGFVLKDFKKEDNSGTTLEITTKPDRLRELKREGGRYIVVFYNGGKLDTLVLE